MNCFKIPNEMCTKIQAMIIRFWWRRWEKERKMHWLRWDKLNRKKKKMSWWDRVIGEKRV